MVKKSLRGDPADSAPDVNDRPAEDSAPIGSDDSGRGNDDGRGGGDGDGNIDISTRAGRAMLFNAHGAPLEPIQANGSVQLNVARWAIITRDMVPEEGPAVKGVVTLILFDPLGDAHAFCQPAVIARWRDLIDLEGAGPWDVPICVKVIATTPKRHGVTNYSLRLIVDEEA